jgi:uncharacterized protein involved in exopolysaccharide biosynthesis
MLDNSSQVPFEIEDQGSLDLLHYYQILKKRKFYGLVPFLCIFAIGSAAAMLWPPSYQSEGKILVESQQIPTDLVRPTVTATAAERIATIQQRVMTRDNLLKIVDKYQMFADQRDKLSRTDLLDLMRANTIVKPVELGVLGAQQNGQNLTVAITVGFTDRKPDVATKVANELITLFLAEDARNRTSRASETTKFLAQEVEKLQTELNALDQKILESRRQMPVLEGALPQLAALKAELAAKSAVYSASHPEIKRLKAQIEAVEKAPITTVAQTAPPNTIGNLALGQMLDPLLLQRVSVQTNLETTNQKLAAARRGENLERDQFSERLEILEQAVPPQKPTKPNRPKLIALAFGVAMLASFAGIWTIESFDKTIRRSSDLAAVANGQLIVALPYIVTKAELQSKKSRILFMVGICVATVLLGLLAAHFFVKPLDELWRILLTRLSL